MKTLLTCCAAIALLCSCSKEGQIVTDGQTYGYVDEYGTVQAGFKTYQAAVDARDEEVKRHKRYESEKLHEKEFKPVPKLPISQAPAPIAFYYGLTNVQWASYTTNDNIGVVHGTEPVKMTVKPMPDPLLVELSHRQDDLQAEFNSCFKSLQSSANTDTILLELYSRQAQKISELSSRQLDTQLQIQSLTPKAPQPPTFLATNIIYCPTGSNNLSGWSYPGPKTTETLPEWLLKSGTITNTVIIK